MLTRLEFRDDYLEISSHLDSTLALLNECHRNQPNIAEIVLSHVGTWANDHDELSVFNALSQLNSVRSFEFCIHPSRFRKQVFPNINLDSLRLNKMRSRSPELSDIDIDCLLRDVPLAFESLKVLYISVQV